LWQILGRIAGKEFFERGKTNEKTGLHRPVLAPVLGDHRVRERKEPEALKESEGRRGQETSAVMTR